MQFDAYGASLPLEDVAGVARAVEELGFSGLWFTESKRPPYLGCAVAGEVTDALTIGTAIAVAFPRSPMITAKVAWELAEASHGRFTLGLGTQIKAHIERRYSAEYLPPGPRMRDYVRALHAIFAAFRGGPLEYHGDYYDFSLLPAQCSPGPIAVPDPPIYVAAVLPWMSAMAGELCDGVHVHPFHSADYLRANQIPNVAEGARRAGRSVDAVTFEIPVMTAVGDTADEIATTREHARTMIAFYGSTRTYSPVFEHHGYDGLSDALHERQREGDIKGMAALITDDVLQHYYVEAGWDELADALVERYGDLAPSVRLMSYTAINQYQKDPAILDRWGEVANRVRGLTS